jgi:hypothetical protein
MTSDTNGKYNVAGDRPLGAAKPVDPATRLSELLAQSLEELTRPFDPPRVDPLMRPQPVASSTRPAGEPARPEAAQHEPDLPVALPASTETRLDDKALAELEAELFAAAASKPAAAAPEKPAEPVEPAEPAAEAHAPEEKHDAPVVDPFVDRVEPATPVEVAAPVPLVPEPAHASEPAPTSDADTARVIAKVRRLMLISMAVTVIAVGSVFGFIGYRVFKGEGSVAKTADKVVPAAPTGGEMTISLPRGARVVHSAVAEDRLIITLDVGGKTEVRTFDLKTLQPAGRLTFSTTP